MNRCKKTALRRRLTDYARRLGEEKESYWGSALTNRHLRGLCRKDRPDQANPQHAYPRADHPTAAE